MFFRTAVLIALALAAVKQIEPAKEGRFHDRIRQETMIVSSETPAITVVSPLEGDLFEGEFVVGFTDWDYQPDDATDPVNAFANGKQRQNTGHVHGWVFNEYGDQVRFYGAAGSTYENDLYRKPDAFPPGIYKAYFALQYDDHTPAIQARAPDFPPIACVSFVVDEAEGALVEDRVNVPNCGCGMTPCQSSSE